jgi:hypothetical protein
MYPYDQDKELTLLRFDDENGNARGFLSFFAVHGTSLYNVCCLFFFGIVGVFNPLKKILE